MMNKETTSGHLVFTEDQMDLLQELINIGVGRAADALSQLVESRIQLCVPEIKMIGSQKAREIFEARSVSEETMVTQSFNGSISGRLGMLLDKKSAILMTSLLSDEQCTENEINLEQEGIILEVGNIVLNGVMGSISNAIEDQLDYSIPEIARSNSIKILLEKNMLNKPTVLLADVSLHVENSAIEGSIIVVFDAEEICLMLNQIIDES